MRGLWIVLLCVNPFGSVMAGDWPQILGPDRDGVAHHESLNFAWPATGPRVLWKVPVGSGFAGPAIQGKIAVAFHRQGGDEIAVGLDLQDGHLLWTTRFPSSYVPSVSYDDGPRCVPTIHQERVLLYGAQGELRCLNLADGKLVWSVETHKLYGADEGYFGAGSSPLVVGGKVIVNVGGARNGAGMVAFALETGKEVWKATDEAASYSSPVLAQVGERNVVIAITRMQCVGLDPNEGAVLFSFPFGKRGPTVNAANPLVIGNKLFLSASYGIGATYGTLTEKSFAPIWSSDEKLSSQYTTSVVSEGKLFGVHGRQDLGIPALRCLDPLSQRVLWEQELEHYASLILADGHLLVATIGGELVVVKADPKMYREVARAKIQDATERGASLPALANGLYLTRDGQTLRCLDLRK